MDSIAVWAFKDAPESVRCITGSSDWVAFIRGELASPNIEALFLRWDNEAEPVIRRVLPGGAVVIAGNYPKLNALAASGASGESRPRASRWAVYMQ